MKKKYRLKFHRMIGYGAVLSDDYTKEMAREQCLKNMRHALKHTSELSDKILLEICVEEEWDE